MDRLNEVKALQKQIVSALEKGEDPAPLLRKLADVRREIAMECEREELQKVAEARKALRDRASAVIGTTQRQGVAIEAFLKARGSLLEQLQPMLEGLKQFAQMAKPSWEKHSGECYLFSDAMQFGGALTGIPKELLPEDFKCPTLEMTQPSERSLGKANEALFYFQSCIGILASFRKGYMTLHSQPADDSLLLSNETAEIELNCRVCNDDKVKLINAALEAGKPLRELEAEFNVSRSTLSRHKRNCLHIEAVRFID